MKQKIPNILTTIRIFAVIPFISLLGYAAHGTIINQTSIQYNNMNNETIAFISAASIFIIAMFTDFLDGYIARKWGVVSDYGKLFDPLADKIITTSAFILLSLIGLIPWWIITIMILRDVTVDASRNLAVKNGIDVSASIWGKIKTLAQSIGIIIIFLGFPFFENITLYPGAVKMDAILWALNSIVYVGFAFSLYSGLYYYSKIWKYLKK